MANPFRVNSSSMCRYCETEVEEGEMMYMDDNEEICADCAEERGIVCACGNYKNSTFEECSNCNEDE